MPAPAVPPAVMEAMRKKAAEIRQRMTSGANFVKRWDLNGKNSIVQPGHEVEIRLLPRWDFLNQWTVDAAGKRVDNPEYVPGLIFLPVSEHWWDKADGTTVREWCPKTFGADQECPICEGVESLGNSADKADRELAKRSMSKEVYAFNAMVGGVGARLFSEEGKPDIRMMVTPNTVCFAISNIITGGEKPAFARGAIYDHRSGYDLKLSRPASQADRWKVDCAPESSPLFLDGEKGKYSGWSTMLVDLPAAIEKELKTYDQLYEAFYGTPAPSGGGMEAGADEPPDDPGQADEPVAGRASAPVGPDPDPLEDGPEAVDLPPARAAVPARSTPSRPAPGRSAPAPARRSAPPSRGRR